MRVGGEEVNPLLHSKVAIRDLARRFQRLIGEPYQKLHGCFITNPVLPALISSGVWWTPESRGVTDVCDIIPA